MLIIDIVRDVGSWKRYYEYDTPVLSISSCPLSSVLENRKLPEKERERKERNLTSRQNNNRIIILQFYRKYQEIYHLLCISYGRYVLYRF